MSTLIPILRRSAYQSAKSCLHRYKAIWIDGVPDDNEYSLRGIAFHSAAHRYVRRLYEKQLPADSEEARLAFIEGVGEALTPAPLVPEVKALFDRWAQHFQLDLEAYVGAEEHQRTDLGHGFQADLVYARPHELELIDFKTYYAALTETQLRDEWQARWYMFAARKVWKNFPAYRFTHSYVRLGRLTSVVFEEHELDGFVDEVAAISKVIEEATARNEWPATPGDECRFCQLACPAVDDLAVTPKRLPDRATAIKAAQLILAGDRMLKVAKGALKAYCATEGTVSVNGMDFANRPSESVSYPISEVLRVLTERGRMGAFESEDLTLSRSALAKLFKAYPQLEEDLSSVARSKTTYRFAARAAGMGDEDDE